MPASTLHILHAETFDDLEVGTEKKSRHQLGLEEAATDDSEHTLIKRLGFAANGSVEKYLVTHEEIEKVQGRWRREKIEQLIVGYDFEIFRERESSIIFARGPRDTVQRAFRRLQPVGYTVREAPLNLELLRGGLKGMGATVDSAHFSELKIARVSSVGMYGDEVDESDDFEHYKQAGGLLSALSIRMTIGQRTERFMLTKRRTIVVYTRFDEASLLEFGREVNAVIEQVLAESKAPQA